MKVSRLYQKLSAMILWIARFLEMVVALILFAAILAELCVPLWRFQRLNLGMGDTQLFQPFLVW